MSGAAAKLLANVGIASTSFMGAMLGRQSSPSVMSAPPVPSSPGAETHETVDLLERCHGLGARGVQTKITGDPERLRARAEELGMWIEAMISVRSTEEETLEKEIVNAKAAGCKVARDGLLGGRRYETFHTLAEWQTWKSESLAKLHKAVSIFKKHKLTLALENHKDWTLEEYVELLRSYSSEYLGACLDFGNNITLLDGVTDTVIASLPYIKATHFKDLVVAPNEEGFELAEVPLGTGVLDLPALLGILADAQPDVHLALEMITRDPLSVPCLTDRYWVTFPERTGLALARTLRFVNENRSAGPLPRPEELTADEHRKLEETNIGACFDFVRHKAATVWG